MPWTCLPALTGPPYFPVLAIPKISYAIGVDSRESVGQGVSLHPTGITPFRSTFHRRRDRRHRKFSRVCTCFLQLVHWTVIGWLYPPYIALHLLYRPNVNDVVDQGDQHTKDTTHTQRSTHWRHLSKRHNTQHTVQKRLSSGTWTCISVGRTAPP